MAFVVDNVRNISWICSRVKDAISAARTSGTICTGAVASGNALGKVESWPAGAADTDSAGATAVVTEATDGGGASLPLLRIQIPIRRLAIRFFGSRSSSKSSI